MLKKRLLISIVLILALVFVGCSSDDNVDELILESIEAINSETIEVSFNDGTEIEITDFTPSPLQNGEETNVKFTYDGISYEGKVTYVIEEQLGIESVVQKGPFIQGSTITVQELNNNFQPTGTTYGTETDDDFGSFSIETELSSEYVEIISNGYFFNEVSGEIDGPITMRVVTPVRDDSKVNVNILTTIARDRIIYLIRNEDMSFEEAKRKAEKEVLRVFHIPEKIIEEVANFEEMDISQEGKGNAILLAVSSIILGDHTPGELSEFLSKIRSDLIENGELDNQNYIDNIRDNSMNLDLKTIKNNLNLRYNQLGTKVSSPRFEDYIDSRGNGIINKFDNEYLKVVFNLPYSLLSEVSILTIENNIKINKANIRLYENDNLITSKKINNISSDNEVIFENIEINKKYEVKVELIGTIRNEEELKILYEGKTATPKIMAGDITSVEVGFVPLPAKSLEVEIINIDEVNVEKIILNHPSLNQKITRNYNTGVVFNNGNGSDNGGEFDFLASRWYLKIELKDGIIGGNVILLLPNEEKSIKIEVDKDTGNFDVIT